VKIKKTSRVAYSYHIGLFDFSELFTGGQALHQPTGKAGSKVIKG